MHWEEVGGRGAGLEMKGLDPVWYNQVKQASKLRIIHAMLGV